jgi:hypothetical protein
MVGTRRLEILTSIVSIWRELMASFVLDRDPSIKSFPNVFGHTQDQARLGFEPANASLCRNENGFGPTSGL